MRKKAIQIWPAILLGLLALYFLLIIVAITVGSAELSLKKSALALAEWLRLPIGDNASQIKKQIKSLFSKFVCQEFLWRV